jgi:hypothetical protein
VIINS